MSDATERLQRLVREVPDFPKPGIVFKDVTPLLADPEGLRTTIDLIVERWRGAGIDKVAGIDARGFLLAGPVAYLLGCGMVVLRKPGKLPWNKYTEHYSLEYGRDGLEVHTDAVAKGERVLVIDDLLATGGTAEAADKLIARTGGEVVGFTFLVELAALHGAERLGADRVHALLRYAEGETGHAQGV